MLDPKTINQIEEFVYEKPRSIQEIANYINKNWRTADRYVEQIETDFGTISTRVFRKGTRGALKIIYWSSVEKVSSSIFQQRLEHDIINAKKKDDFSPFDIFEYVDKKHRKSNITEKFDIKDLVKKVLKAKKQVLIFSGNLSIINIENSILLHALEKISKKKVSIKILCRVDLPGKKNIEKTLSLNLKNGKQQIEIRHDAHPLRGVVVDGKLLSLKEIKRPTGKIKELDKKLFITYTITEKSWVEWISKIFWNKFSNSLDANKRIKNLKEVMQG